MEATGRTAIVAGGGIVGLACARRLAGEGFAVSVIDPDSAVEPPSWGNAGHIATEQVEPLASRAALARALRLFFKRGGPVAAPIGDFSTWLPFFARALLASGGRRFRSGTAALASCMDQAVPAWRRLLDDAGQPELLIADGHYVVWESPGSAKASLKRWLRTNTGATTFREARRDELGRLEGLAKARFHGGIRFEGTGQIRDPTLLLDALKESIAQAGGRFVSSRVQGISARRKRATLVTEDRQERDADIVVIAAGLDSGRLLRQAGSPVPIIAERGYHLQSERGDWPRDMPPVVFEDRAMVVTGFASTLRATSFVEFARYDRPPTDARWNRLERHIDELGLPFGKPRSRWMGARPTLPDYLPAIGRSGLAHNLLYAFGHQHLGLTMAAITGEIIADLARDRTPSVDVGAFDVDRFARY